MVLETIIVAGVAGVMLGWNVHVMRKNGVCCPPQRTNGVSGSSPQTVPQDQKLRRRRSSGSRKNVSHDKEAEARRRARAMGTGGGGSNKKVVMDAVQEQLEEVQAPAFDAGAPLGVAEGAGRIDAGGEGGIPGA